MRIFLLLISIVLSSLTRGGLCPAQDSPERAGPDQSGRMESTPPSERPMGDEDRLLDELDQLDRRLYELESRQEKFSSHRARLEHEIAREREKLTGLRKNNRGLQETARARLVSLYKFRQIGYATLLLSAGKLETAIEGGYAAADLLRRDQRLFLDLEEGSAEIRRIEAILSRKKEESDSVKRQIDTREQELASARQQKIELLGRVRRQDALFARYNTRLEESQKMLEKRASSRKPIFTSRENPFPTRHGTLPIPTAGEIINTYDLRKGAASGSLLYNNGVIINAPKGQPIQAVYDGMVVFADWFKEYGKVMIIDHGDHYHSLIAHADELLKMAGESVKGGEMIATVGNTGSLDGPKLYFEIRHYGKPVDPMEWLAGRKLSKE